MKKVAFLVAVVSLVGVGVLHADMVTEPKVIEVTHPDQKMHDVEVKQVEINDVNTPAATDHPVEKDVIIHDHVVVPEK